MFEKLSFESLENEEDTTEVNKAETPTTPINNKLIESSIQQQRRRSSGYNITKLNKNFNEIKLQLNVKLHKNTINDCCFVVNLNNDDLMHKSEKQKNKLHSIPFICSVSADNWLKIYSIEEKSIHRSHNLNNFSLSSIDYVQLNEKHQHTLLLVSSWDNSIYIYDINYSRCIYTHSNAHDDAVSRISVFSREASVNKKKSGSEEYSYFVLTSSWDSLVKIWRLIVTISMSKSDNESQITTHIDSIRMQFYSELCHDTSIVDFRLSSKLLYLASLCDDASIQVWKFTDINSSQFSLPVSYYTFNLGDITDCQLIDEYHNSKSFDDIESTIAFCTKDSLIKIVNIKTKSELFSLNLCNLLAGTSCVSLTKLIYNIDYIVTIGTNGFIYFIDLNQTPTSIETKSSYLSNKIKLCSSSLQCLSIYNESIVSIGDSDGNLYFLSFNNV